MRDRQAQTRKLSSPDQMGLQLPTPRRIPLEFTLSDVRSLKSESDAINFSVRCSGYESKEIPMLFGIDPGQWSNITRNTGKHFPHERRNEFMDFVGNEILLMYGVESRNYDFSTLRRHQSDVEIELQQAKQRIAELERKDEIQQEFMRKVMGNG